MHADFCLPLSEVVYEGKLRAAPNNNRQNIRIPNRNLITEEKGIMVVNVEMTATGKAAKKKQLLSLS
jgi:uncharacterized protein